MVLAKKFPVFEGFRLQCSLVGVWRSLVAHLHGVQGVPSSNPGTPTKRNNEKAIGNSSLFRV
jgi:hypothetical protein